MNPIVIAVIIVFVLLASAGGAFAILYWRLRRAMTARKTVYGIAKSMQKNKGKKQK